MNRLQRTWCWHLFSQKGDTPLHIAIRGRSRRLAELLLRNPKDGRLLYRPNKAGETPYNVDCSHQKSILTQIFGARTSFSVSPHSGPELHANAVLWLMFAQLWVSSSLLQPLNEPGPISLLKLKSESGERSCNWKVWSNEAALHGALCFCRLRLLREPDWISSACYT